MSLVQAKNLTIKLAGSGKMLVDNISFSINPGETLALVGESGSGKSLSALALMQLLGKQFTISGEVDFNGQDVAHANMQSIRGNDMSMIFQEPMTALNPLHTIGRQIGEVMTIHQSGIQNLESRIKDVLEQVGLSHFKDRLDAYPHQLSGGERQRVMIAMAMANKPKLLIADEPTTALDVHVEKTILDLLSKLKAELGMSMLFITHDLPMVRRMADKVAVMRMGKIVEQGAVEDVFNHPKHAYTKQLLDSLPKGEPVKPTVGAKQVISAENVTVKFPIKKGVFARTVGYNTALEGASFQLDEGETLGVVGQSGSGKTTLAMALLRMQPYAGRVVLLGKDLQQLKGKILRKVRGDMQLVFQDPFSSLNPRMTVGQIIAEGLAIHEPNCNNHLARIKEVLEQVGLTADMIHRYPHEFSGGQRQRISVARAMVLQPKLVILDEPTSALDVTVQMQILDLLKTFQSQQQLSYVFITHDLRVIRTIAHRLLVLKDGHVVEAGNTEDVLRRPIHGYTKALVEAALA